MAAFMTSYMSKDPVITDSKNVDRESSKFWIQQQTQTDKQQALSNTLSPQ